MNKPEIKPGIAFGLPRFGIILIVPLLLSRHGFPLLLLPPIEVRQKQPLDDKSGEGEGAYGYQYGVPSREVGGVVGPVDLRPDQGPNLHDDVVSRGGDGALLHVEGVLRDPGRDDGMEVGVARDERHQREAGPLPPAVGKGQEGDQQRHDPELAEKAVEGALVEIVAAVGQSQHGDDLEYG